MQEHKKNLSEGFSAAEGDPTRTNRILVFVCVQASKYNITKQIIEDQGKALKSNKIIFYIFCI